MLTKLLSAASLATVARYGIVVVCAVLLAGGRIDLDTFTRYMGNLDKILLSLGVLLPMVGGITSAIAGKATIGGKTVAVKNLSPGTQAAIEAATHTAVAKKEANFLELLLGVFIRR